MLTWIYEQPYFWVDNKKEKCLLLSFGLEFVDDIEIQGERFFIDLQKNGAEWRVELDKASSYWSINKDMVDNLMQEINNALMKKEDYDICDYVLSHKANGSYFQCFVHRRYA